MLNNRIVIDEHRFSITVARLSRQILENSNFFKDYCLIGIQPRGIFLAERIFQQLQSLVSTPVLFGTLDNTFYRDDFRSSEKQLVPSSTDLPFSIEGKSVILIDDVMYTGRTVRAAMDALLDFGRPSKVELMVLVERRFSRQLPIQPDYIGVSVDSMENEKVRVSWKEQGLKDQVWIERVNHNLR